MRYCYVTYGSWEHNAGFTRPREMGKALVERGVDVTYVVDDMPWNRAHVAELLHPKASLEFVRRHVGQTRDRRKLLSSLRPDFLHLLNPHAKSLAATVGNSKLKIVGEWDEPPVYRPFGRARHALEVVLDAWLRRRADRIVACTRFLQQHFRDAYGLDVPYIPHATYLKSHPDGESPFSEPTAVYMGNFLPAWDHDILFEAARLLAERGLKPPIHFLGTGPDMDRWKAFCAEHKLDNILMPGFVSGEKLWRHLRHAHVLLFPIRPTVLNMSRCPSKIFAYAQARRPVIATRVGELPEVLGEFPNYIEYSPRAYADAIAAAMAAPRGADVEYHVERHTYADRAQRLLDVLNGPGPRRAA